MRKIIIYNRKQQPLEIGLEPEGDCFVLQAGTECEFRYSTHKGDPELEIEIEENLVSIHCLQAKEVWQNGKRLK